MKWHDGLPARVVDAVQTLALEDPQAGALLKAYYLARKDPSGEPVILIPEAWMREKPQPQRSQ